MNKKNTLILVLIGIVCCLAMTLVDGVIRPGYIPKSAIKICLFLLLPLVVTAVKRELSCRDFLRFQPKGFLAALVLGGCVYGVILGSYFIVRPFFDFSSIADSLTKNAGVTADNFLYVSLYISFANSMLEEFFFRGFLFMNLKKHHSRKLAYWFSAAAFALYHVAMMIGWFDISLFLLTIVGLFIGGLIFNYFNEKYKNIYVTWLIHMFANFAINYIGFMLFNIV